MKEFKEGKIFDRFIPLLPCFLILYVKSFIFFFWKTGSLLKYCRVYICWKTLEGVCFCLFQGLHGLRYFFFVLYTYEKIVGYFELSYSFSNENIDRSKLDLMWPLVYEILGNSLMFSIFA